MGHLRVNTLKDRLGFFLHYGLTGTVFAGAFFALGSPFVLAGIATLGMHIKRQADLVGKDEVQAVLNDEKIARIDGKTLFELKSENSKSMWNRLGLDNRVNPAGGKNPLYRRIEPWIRQYAGKLGLAKIPPFLLMNGATGWVANLSETYNERADVYAFARANGNVALAESATRNLKPEELKAVIARETAYIAANHSDNRDSIHQAGRVAKAMTFLNNVLTCVSSVKNAGLYAGAIASGFAAYAVYKHAGRLNPDNPDDKIRLDRCATATANTTLAGLAVAFGAPEVLLAQTVGLATRISVNLVEKSYARQTELHADRIAAQLTGNPAALCTALTKVVEKNLPAEPTFNRRKPSKGFLSSFFDRVRDLNEVQPNVGRRADRLMGLRISPLDTVPMFSTP